MGCTNYVTAEDILQIEKSIAKDKKYITPPVIRVDFTKYFNSKDSKVRMAAAIKKASLIKSSVNVKSTTEHRNKKLTSKTKIELLTSVDTKNVPKEFLQYAIAADMDHVKELQGGGTDTKNDLIPLNLSVNRSSGVQISHAIKNFSIGQEFTIEVIGDYI